MSQKWSSPPLPAWCPAPSRSPPTSPYSGFLQRFSTFNQPPDTCWPPNKGWQGAREFSAAYMQRKGVRPQIFLKMLPPTNCSKKNKIGTAAQAGGHFLTLWLWLVQLQSFRRLRLLDSDGTEIVCSCVAFSSNTFEAAASTPSITVWTPWRSGWTLSSG